jgi:hypothetical protein
MSTQTPVFIVSAGRSGSTFLAKLINQHPDIVCMSDLFEPVAPSPYIDRDAPYFDRSKKIAGEDFFAMLSAPSSKPRLRYWRERQTKERLFVPTDENMVSLLMSYTIPFIDADPLQCFNNCRSFFENRPEKAAADHLIDFFDWLRDRHSGKIWIERSGGALGLTPRIIETWPQAKIIHNYRDGRESAISMQRYPFFRMYLKMLNTPDMDEWDFDAMPPIEDIGKMWSDWVLLAEDAIDAMPTEQTHRLPYENLMGRTEQSLRALIEFVFDRTPNETDQTWIKKCAAQTEPSPLKFHDLPQTERIALEKSCAPGLQRLGYSREERRAHG